MMKVLAAEMSDPHRLRRGKQYARTDAVIDIVVEPGVVTCEVQGSRPVPYVASLEVAPGDGMPLRRHVRATCTCPDLSDPGNRWSTGDTEVCKHVVAAMFVFSDELLVEPELLDVWRGRATAEPDTAPDAVVVPPAAPPPDPVEALLVARGPLPDLPPIAPADPRPPTRPELAAVLHDALVVLRGEWA
jgi:hypothetical protein